MHLAVSGKQGEDITRYSYYSKPGEIGGQLTNPPVPLERLLLIGAEYRVILEGLLSGWGQPPGSSDSNSQPALSACIGLGVPAVRPAQPHRAVKGFSVHSSPGTMQSSPGEEPKCHSHGSTDFLGSIMGKQKGSWRWCGGGLGG